MATLNRAQAIPLGDYEPGTYQLPEVNVAPQATQFYFEVARCTTATPDIWPSVDVKLEVVVEISEDNGNTWRNRGAFTAQGGIHVHRTGIELPVTTIVCNIGTGNQRKLRGRATVTGGVLRTQGFFETRN